MTSLNNAQTQKQKNKRMFNPRAALASTLVWASILTLITFSPLSAADGAVTSTEAPVWVDVRTWAEHKVNHIDGDARIHYTEIVDSIAEEYPDKATPIRLYCAAGVRAEKAKSALLQAGYSNVENAGGIESVRRQRGLAGE